MQVRDGDDDDDDDGGWKDGWMGGWMDGLEVWMDVLTVELAERARDRRKCFRSTRR